MPTLRCRNGQITAETAVLMLCAIAGLIAMKGYVQRAIQGNLFSGTQAVGLQYDPRNGRQEQASIAINESVKRQVAWSMFGADILQQPPECTEATGNSDACPRAGLDDRYWRRRARLLSSLPSGPVPREPAFEESEMHTTWTATSDATYDDWR